MNIVEMLILAAINRWEHKTIWNVYYGPLNRREYKLWYAMYQIKRMSEATVQSQD